MGARVSKQWLPPESAVSPHHHSWTNCHPVRRQVPAGESLAQGLPLALAPCCCSFTERGPGQFHTSFDLRSRIRASSRGSLPVHRQPVPPAPASLRTAEPVRACLGHTRGPEQTALTTRPFLPGLLSGRCPGAGTCVSEASADVEEPQGKSLGIGHPAPSVRWETELQRVLRALTTLLKVHPQSVAGSCPPLVAERAGSARGVPRSAVSHRRTR